MLALFTRVVYCVSMFKQSLLVLLGVAIGYVGGMSAIGHSQEAGVTNLRFEAALGKCKYGKATDGAWYKNGYPQQIQLSTTCGSLGISQTPFKTMWGNLGYRIAYVDFGTARADTYVPLIDSEANSFPSGANCNQSTLSGCVGEFRQWGKARGISIGPVLEKETKLATFGIEGGAFLYRSYWQVVGIVPGPGTCPSCGPAKQIEWNQAAGNHATWYVGLTAEKYGFFVQARMYHAAYASQASVTKDPGSIGMIGGPLYSFQAGYQWKLD